VNPLEKSIEKALVDACNRRGFFAIKLGFGGLPDRVIFLPHGRVYFDELKTLTGTPGPAQKIWKARLERLGFHVYNSRSREEALANLESEVRNDPR
jgi:hypothetical protein